VTVLLRGTPAGSQWVKNFTISIEVSQGNRRYFRSVTKLGKRGGKKKKTNTIVAS